jgi:uroporphyrinogen decarboxylase
MTSRERVKAAIDRTPADRIPCFMWFHPDTVRILARQLEVEPDEVEIVFGNDVRQTWVNNNYAMEGIVHEADGEGHSDIWGIEWVRRFGFNQIEGYPLKGADRDTLLSYRFPDDRLEELLAPMQRVSDARDDYFLGCDISPCAFEMYWRLRSMDDALLDFALDTTLVEAMIGRCVDFADLLAREAIGRYPLDWLWTGDDVAFQHGMIISPAQWRELVKPGMARLFARGKEAGLPVAYHCCGALRPIIGDLVEIGCDVLNPVQVGCPGMDPASLKAEFGEALTFMGGVDTQDLLPRGTPLEVRRETTKLIEMMTGGDGGFIFAASHSIPPETPIDNIWALYEAAGMTKESITDRAADIRARDVAASAHRPATSPP